MLGCLRSRSAPGSFLQQSAVPPAQTEIGAGHCWEASPCPRPGDSDLGAFWDTCFSPCLSPHIQLCLCKLFQGLNVEWFFVFNFILFLQLLLLVRGCAGSGCRGAACCLCPPSRAQVHLPLPQYQKRVVVGNCSSWLVASLVFLNPAESFEFLRSGC